MESPERGLPGQLKEDFHQLYGEACKQLKEVFEDEASRTRARAAFEKRAESAYDAFTHFADECAGDGNNVPFLLGVMNANALAKELLTIFASGVMSEASVDDTIGRIGTCLFDNVTGPLAKEYWDRYLSERIGEGLEG